MGGKISKISSKLGVQTKMKRLHRPNPRNSMVQVYEREITLVGKVVFRYAEILKSVVKSENLPKSINPQIR